MAAEEPTADADAQAQPRRRSSLSRLFARSRSGSADADDDKAAECVDCCICLEAVPQNDRKRTETDCGHVFHSRCLKKWLSKAENPGCPLCKAPMDRPRPSRMSRLAAAVVGGGDTASRERRRARALETRGGGGGLNDHDLAVMLQMREIQAGNQQLEALIRLGLIGGGRGGGGGGGYHHGVHHGGGLPLIHRDRHGNRLHARGVHHGLHARQSLPRGLHGGGGTTLLILSGDNDQGGGLRAMRMPMGVITGTAGPRATGARAADDRLLMVFY
mmetsp:Transcript_32528/g.75300  ORF Transcript_32528/g.75300 Transcript_32528/m.75300 type:complete len:273 (+) Transcript_32528:170-988(+)